MTYLEHISQIADEFAKEIAPDSKHEQMAISADSIGFLNKVLDEYCLVKKSVVEFEYNEVKEYLEKDRYLDMYDEYEAKRGLLESLFPELAKEVES